MLIHWGSWPLIFLVNVPVGVLALVGVRHIPRELGGLPHAIVPRFDSAGFVGLAVALTAVTYGAVEGPQRGWWAASVWPTWTGGLLLLIAYGWWARRHRHPIVDVSFMANGQAVLALILSALVSVVTFGVIFLVPAFMQSIQGRTPLVAGLTLLPQGLVTGVGAVIGNQLPHRWGTRSTVLLGMALLTASTLALYAVTVTSPAWVVALLIMGRGFAIGLVIQPLLNGLMGSLPDDRIPDATTVFNIVERVGGTRGDWSLGQSAYGARNGSSASDAHSTPPIVRSSANRPEPPHARLSSHGPFRSDCGDIRVSRRDWSRRGHQPRRLPARHSHPRTPKGEG